MKLVSRFFKDESGATAIEYGLIAALIAVVIIGAVTTLGTEGSCQEEASPPIREEDDGQNVFALHLRSPIRIGGR